MAPEPGKIFAATYSNVPVYECFVEGNHVMRRRADSWINATHILKVADFDKPARTRILEREVQKGTHEKVQGGYGKYQGTWIPLAEGRLLAEKHKVLDKLLPILDFVPGDKTPPPAPKHTVAASSKPRQPRQSNAAKKAKVAPAHQHVQEDYSQHHFQESETPDNMTLTSDAYNDDFDGAQFTSSRKRKRIEDVITPADEQHQLWSEELLDYFMLQDGPADPFSQPPMPPAGIDLDRPIDDKGHTALHWAAAMGDTGVVKDLINRGARVDCLSKNGETPLMRAVTFTNSFDKQTMEKLSGWLVHTVSFVDWHGSTVFHIIASTTSSKSKYACARYYLDAILNRMAEMFSPPEVEKILNIQDRQGDTAITIAARNGARKCVRSLIGRHAAVDLPNDQGETADGLIVQLNHRRRDGRHRQLSSSPFQLDPTITNAHNPALSRTLLQHQHPLLHSSPSFDAPDPSTSEAATFLTTQIFPLMQSKSAKLAAAFDAEMSEKDNEVAELERVVKGRREEIDGLKRGVRDLIVRDKDDAFDADLGQRLNALTEQVERRREGTQMAELAGLVDEELRHAGANGASAGVENEEADKHDLIRRILDMQASRRELVREVVRNQSLAGLGQRQADYRRLITGALGVREADVEDMLGEILAELEESAGEVGLVDGGVRGLAAGQQSLGGMVVA